MLASRLLGVKLPHYKASALISWTGTLKCPLSQLCRPIPLLVLGAGACFPAALATPGVSSIFVFAGLAGELHIASLVISLTIIKRSIFSIFICHLLRPVKCLLIIIPHFLWIVHHFLMHKSSHILSEYYALFWAAAVVGVIDGILPPNKFYN